MRLGFALAACSLIVGCASTTIIRTNPSGANVMVNGNVIGRTPYTQTDTDPVMIPPKQFTLEMPGYQTATVTAAKTDWANVKTIGFALGGFVLWPLWAGLLWAPDYREIPEVVLVPEVASRPPPPPRVRVAVRPSS
jgi:hypothetical protein